MKRYQVLSSTLKKMTSTQSVRWSFKTSDWNPSNGDVSKCLSLIQEEERQRVFQFVFRKDLKPSIMGRVLIRKYLNTIHKIPNDQIRLERSEKGKPILTCDTMISNETTFDFNVSHQGDYCIIAGDAYTKVGCDMMKIEYSGGDVNRFFSLMNRQFSPSEWLFIKSSPDDQLSRFMRLWCLKEAYVKAEGFGITCDLQKISFTCPTHVTSTDHVVTDTFLSVNGVRQEDWTFEESLLDSKHSVAVAINTRKPDDHVPQIFQQLSFDDVTQGLTPLNDAQSIDYDKYWTDYSNKTERPT